ncbi:AAA family ATPase [Catalinimonas sp. 4WD22]|uniref:AAA family ATPase n=1 Tax=Catalinimonas locisalis TaxID=3133978 RepID=UPI0031011205
MSLFDETPGGFEQEEGLNEVVSFSGEELANRDVDCIPTLFDPIFPKVGLVTVAGLSDAGKSAFLRQLLIYLVADFDYFIGFEVKAEHKKGIYFSTEDGEESMSYLLKKQLRGISKEASILKNIEFVFDYGLSLLDTLEDKLQANNYDAVVIDAFGDVFTGQMNQNNVVRSFLTKFDRLAKKYKCLIIFLHHCGKNSEYKEPSKNSVIGSQGYEAKMRLVIELREDWNDPDLRHLCIVKGNYLPKEYKSESYVLRFDEYMLFHNTGRRVPFEDLAKPTESDAEKEELKERAIELRQQNKSVREIAKELGKGKSTIDRWTKGVVPSHESTKENSGTGQVKMNGHSYQKAPF